MVRDPYWAYAYWEIEPSRIAAIKTKLGWDFKQAQMIVRVYDITGIAFDGTNALRFADIEITSSVTSWYINLGAAHRTYCVDIGIRAASGAFYCLARSGSVTTPADGVSERVDELWAVSSEEFARICALSGAGLLELHKPVSSPGLFSIASESFSRRQ